MIFTIELWEPSIPDTFLLNERDSAPLNELVSGDSAADGATFFALPLLVLTIDSRSSDDNLLDLRTLDIRSNLSATYDLI